ncbi:MAG: hypothetical protein IPH63_09240 [Flavobacteriales bacterium]|nr:hypothetical protein [Flavobacteriales bacterium]
MPQQDGLRAVLRMEQGRLRNSTVWWCAEVRGPPRLYASIGIRPGDMYNEALLQSVEKRIRELPFVTQRQRPYVQFTPEMSKLFLFLDAKKASSINGILGLQPDP